MAESHAARVCRGLAQLSSSSSITVPKQCSIAASDLIRVSHKRYQACFIVLFMTRLFYAYNNASTPVGSVPHFHIFFYKKLLRDGRESQKQQVTVGKSRRINLSQPPDSGSAACPPLSHQSGVILRIFLSGRCSQKMRRGEVVTCSAR